ncbi:hypothetical protein KY337_02305 [Candidatus Woesearchaeota archaeon]|nr:hypothetical protein [Candidatus Woesearchaeota archaeon]
MRIGIPRALMYYEFGKRWEEFFKELGFEVIVSPDTDNEIYNSGIKSSVTDFCLPVKVFIGHVLWLKDKVDVVFIPRVRSSEEWVFSCPNVIGAVDVIKNSFDVKVLTLDFRDELKSYVDLGKMLKVDEKKIKRIFNKLIKNDKIKNNKDKTNNNHNKILKKEKKKINNSNRIVALVGRTYYVNDNKLNLGIIKKLNELGLDVVTSDSVHRCSFKSHWLNVNRLVGDIEHFNKDKDVKGIIYIKPFNCGPDFLVEQLVKVDKPFLVLKFDEHSSETGMLTRLEAFIDIL